MQVMFYGYVSPVSASDESRCRYYDAFSDEWWFDLRGSFGNLPEGEGTHRGLCIVAHCHF